MRAGRPTSGRPVSGLALALCAALALPAAGAEAAELCKSLEESAEAALRACENWSPKTDVEIADQLLWMGTQHFRLGDYSAAVHDLDRAESQAAYYDWLSDRQPEYRPPLRAIRALAKARLGDSASGLRDANISLLQAPTRSAHAARGEILERMGKVEWAAASYTAALKYEDFSARSNFLGDDDETLRRALDRTAAAVRPLPDDGSVEATLRRALAEGRLEQALPDLEAAVAARPDDQQALFALGSAQFLLAAQHLGQALHRFGLASGEGVDIGLPILRFPVPPNPRPDTLTYDAFRHVIRSLVDDLARADGTLARVTDPAVRLRVHLGTVRLDLDGDGSGGESESVATIYGRIAWTKIDADEAGYLAVDFDAADAAWMQGYGHLLSALGNLLLAYDWRDAFDRTFQMAFPKSGLPWSDLNDLAFETIARQAEIERCLEEATNQAARQTCREGTVDLWAAMGADLLTFVHLMHWPVEDRARMAASLEQLQAAIAASRLSWTRIHGETDDANEWIPGPRQTGMTPAMFIDDRIAKGWTDVLDELDAVLQGRKLIPHWRLKQGVDLRRVFLEPTPLDAVLWLQGSAAKPYLEDGPVSDSARWADLTSLFSGRFLFYAFWLN